MHNGLGLQKRAREKVPTRFGFRIRAFCASKIAFPVDLGDISPQGLLSSPNMFPKLMRL